jgi:hypothetical protein
LNGIWIFEISLFPLFSPVQKSSSASLRKNSEFGFLVASKRRGDGRISTFGFCLIRVHLRYLRFKTGVLAPRNGLQLRAVGRKSRK